MDPQLIIDALTGVLDLETGHQWTSDPIDTDFLGKPATLVIQATPTSQGGGPINLTDVLKDAVDLYEGQSFTTDSFVVPVPTPSGPKNFSVQLTYTVGAPAAPPAEAPAPQKAQTPGQPGKVTPPSGG